MVPRCFYRSHVGSPKDCLRPNRLRVESGRCVTAGSMDPWGICTNNVQAGDKVVLVAGLSVPLVVRLTGNTHRLISPAIISDVMQEQAWERHLLYREEKLTYFRIS